MGLYLFQLFYKDLSAQKRDPFISLQGRFSHAKFLFNNSVFASWQETAQKKKEKRKKHTIK